MKESNEKETQAVLETLAPYRGNLIFSFLLDRLHLSVFGVILIAFIAFSLVNILLNALQGTLWQTPDLPKALFSTSWATHWTSIPFLYSTLIGCAVLVYRWIPFMFADLIDSGVLVISCGQRSFFVDLQNRYKSRVVNLVSVIGLIFFFIGWVIVKKYRQDFSDWTHVEPGCLTVAAWYWIFIGTAAIYVLLHVAYTLIVTFMTINTVFKDTSRFTIVLQFLHPDRCCGLLPVSKFVLRIGWLIALIGLVLAVYIITSYYRLGTIGSVLNQIGPILAVAGYIILVPLVFLWPLLPARRVMREAKYRFQLQISRILGCYIKDVVYHMAKGQVASPKHKQIEVLDMCKRYVDAFPVWPFDMKTLGMFTSKVLFPIVLMIVGMLLKQLFP